MPKPSAGPLVPAAVSHDFLIVSCEHGGNRIPARYRNYFAAHEELLETHRGYDMGALTVARDLASAMRAPLHYSTVSRLLIDLNRSPRHPALFSEITKPLPMKIRQEIAEHYYLPYRTAVADCVAHAVEEGKQAIHLSSHSFTPVLDGSVRNADIGLLYDPTRSAERELCRRWRNALREQAPDLHVRMNYPYSGKSDGLTAALRKRFAPKLYVGIELELNQLHAQQESPHWKALRAVLLRTLREALAG